MKRKTSAKTMPRVSVLAGMESGPARDLQPIVLAKPRRSGDKSVLAALQERRTIRTISKQRLPRQVLSDLLWAAFGVNRKNGPFGIPGRTAASASNSQEIDLYVAMPDGIYLYESVPHRLTPVVAGDLRAKAGNPGQRDSVATAPVSLIYVVDIARYSEAGFQEPGLKDPEMQRSYYYIATGLIAGNVHVFAASQGLAAWFHNCSRVALAKALRLRADQRVLFAQSVGYPVNG